MTPNQKHAARLREIVTVLRTLDSESSDIGVLLAGAQALESTQPRYRIAERGGCLYLIPLDKWDAWEAWRSDAEPGEPSSIFPSWAVHVRRGTVVTGVELL